jgi:hypothetical protein
VTVTVYYDPSDPTEAVLEPGVSGANIALIVFESVFLVFSIWCLRAAIAA